MASNGTFKFTFKHPTDDRVKHVEVRATGKRQAHSKAVVKANRDEKGLVWTKAMIVGWGKGAGKAKNGKKPWHYHSTRW